MNTARPVCILIAALGGEGGGVLADWLVDAAAARGYPVQSTSIPGVSQRTGATTYYVEIYPVAAAALGDREPVLALVPSPGNVDVMLCTELIEAGRAMRAGQVSPERTTLVASTHRVYATGEKIRPGDGRYASEAVLTAAAQLARRHVLFDMARLARDSGSIINAVLFGAAIGCAALPLTRELAEAAIRRSGRSVEANLRGFDAGYAAAAGSAAQAAAPAVAGTARCAPCAAMPEALARRCAAQFPPEMQQVLALGVARLIDYQDEAYAGLYLDRLRALAAAEGGWSVAARAARALAAWMAYEDIMRVAALKCRAGRIERVRREVGAKPGQPVRIFDYFRPGVAELADVLPPRLFAWIESRAARAGPRSVRGGIEVNATSLTGQLALRAVASLARARRSSARYAAEQALIERWLAALRRFAGTDREAAMELAECARLVKGYSDTRNRGRARLVEILERHAEPASPPGALAAAVRRVREAMLDDADEKVAHAIDGTRASSAKVQTVVFMPRTETAGTRDAASRQA